MNLKTSSARLVTSALFVVGLTWAMPSEAFRMIQNTSTGRWTSGSLVACNDPVGFVHWNIRDIDWFHNTAGQGAGKAAALQAAMQSWTNVPNTTYTLNYAGTTGSGWATDGVNTLLWAVGNGCTGSCLALTALVLQPGQVLAESDITFNASFTWNTNGTNYDTEAVAAHELGHSLGIHHTELGSSPLPTMSATYFGTGGRSLENDDTAALQCSENRYPAALPEDYSCVLSTSGSHTCDDFNVRVTNTGGATRTAVVDMRASFNWKTMVVRVESCNPTGWTVNIGDSPSNNGGGGDGFSARHDAEIQAFDRTMSAFRADYNVGVECQANFSGSGCAVQQYFVQNDFFQFDPNVNTLGDIVTNCSDAFLLDVPLYDEADAEDEFGDYEDFFYIGLNRTYGSSSRSGSGVQRACVFLTDATTVNAATVTGQCGF